MDEIDLEAGDGGDEEEDGGDDNDDEEVELPASRTSAQGVTLFTNWLKKKGRKSFATLQTQIDKLAAKAAGKLDGDVSKIIAKLRGVTLQLGARPRTTSTAARSRPCARRSRSTRRR